MREGCQTSRILQGGDESMQLFGQEFVLSFRKREEQPWRQFRGQWVCYHHHRLLGHRPGFSASSLVPEAGLPPWAEGVGAPCWWSWRAEHEGKEDYSQALKSNGICPATFLTCLGQHSPFFSPSSYSLLEWECISLYLCLFHSCSLEGDN